MKKKEGREAPHSKRRRKEKIIKRKLRMKKKEGREALHSKGVKKEKKNDLNSKEQTIEKKMKIRKE